MNNWQDSIYSDCTKGFAEPSAPSLGDDIKISLRLAGDAPVKKIFLRRINNGAEEYLEMKKDRDFGPLSYYSTGFMVNEPVLKYYFVLATDDRILFYTQAGVTTYVPGERNDFVIRCDFVQPDWVKGAVFYQIFPNSFKDHSLRGIKEKIPYLKELGVNALYLNPIFTARSDHKYDCSDYFSVDPGFGGDEALIELSDALHENGMKLILDISINHTGLENKWVREKRYFYFEDETGELEGWAGYRGLPVLDYRNEEVKDLVYRKKDSAIRKWLRPPYNIDGWRFDVADVFGRHDDLQIADELWNEVCGAIREEKEDAIIIGEHWGDCTCYLESGLWSSCMNYFGFGRIIRQFAGLQDLFLERNETLRAVPYEMTAGDVVRRTDEFYNCIPGAVAECSMNLFDSHDVARAHNYKSISFKKWKAMALAQLLWVGIPCVYYGDELGIDGYTANDRGYRYQMPWEKEASLDTNEYYRIYKRVIELRRNETAFSEGGRKVLFADGKILAIARFMNENIYVGVLSMETHDRTISIPIDILGANSFDDTDAFGVKLMGGITGDGALKINIPSGESYLIKTRRRDDSYRG